MNGLKLLSRTEFKEKVFARDKNKCVVCGGPAVDAHHLLDRSLWKDGGYYIDNGVSLCSDNHLKAEKGLITCTELRNLANIKTVLLPPTLDSTKSYDKWGKEIPN